MELAFLFAALGGGVAVLLAAGWHVSRTQPRVDQPLLATSTRLPGTGGPVRPVVAPTQIPAQREAHTDRFGALPNTHRLVGPPLVSEEAAGLRVGMGPMTLRDWLVHCHPERDNVWADVVTDFYGAAAADPEIGDYFVGVDMATLQKHFLAALMMLASNGITVGVVRRMRERHSDVRNSRGEPINGETFDAVVGVLAGLLADRGVPPATLQQVGELISPLREVIVLPAEGQPVG